MLGQTGIIAPEEAAAIQTGLEKLLARYESGELEFDVRNEDIHMNMEALLTEEIGPVAGSIRLAPVMTRWRQICTSILRIRSARLRINS